jgi:hypothetical protein
MRKPKKQKKGFVPRDWYLGGQQEVRYNVDVVSRSLCIDKNSGVGSIASTAGLGGGKSGTGE